MSKEMRVLGIESSCDECSASVVHWNSEQPFNVQVKSVATFSQIEIHQPYGGVVPEVASRNHLESINPMIEQALEKAQVEAADLDLISVTSRPGLVGALLVGVSAAKALAYAARKPLVPVHHLEGHAVSLFLDRPDQGQSPLPELPVLLAIISGGHTNLYVMKEYPGAWSEAFLKESLVGRSRDDAAGEAFDKTAKLMGFSYPGGKKIDQIAQEGGRPNTFDLPRALKQKSVLDFSFSGLKTQVAILIERLKSEGQFESQIHDLCASVQEAIVDALMKKILLAQQKYGCRSIAIVGGVAANSRLRSRLQNEPDVPVYFPHLRYCTDNAAMIAAAGLFRRENALIYHTDDFLTLNAKASAEI